MQQLVNIHFDHFLLIQLIILAITPQSNVLTQMPQAIQYLLLYPSSQKNRILNLHLLQNIVYIVPHSSTQLPILPNSPASTLTHFKMISGMMTTNIHGNILDTREGILSN